MIRISNIIGKLNRRSLIGKKQAQPRLINHSQPSTLKTVVITAVCVIAFFYALGVLVGEPADGTDVVADDAPTATDAPPGVIEFAPPETAVGEAEAEQSPAYAQIYYGDLELPVDGATGYATVKMNMTATAGLPIEIVRELQPGTAFLIIREEGDKWQVLVDGVTGWVRHSACMINLPDVIPSIKYNCTNTYGSLFVSGGKDIPDVTGAALYEGLAYNERLGGEEFIVPVMYSMSKRICQAQRNALTNNESLVIYEAFRPFSVQRGVAEALDKLSREDRDVRNGINAGSWSLTWFISTSVSNHQLGGAIDVALAKVARDGYGVAGPYQYLRVEEYEDYNMPSPMHELSAASVTYTYPVNSASSTAWQRAALAPAMAENEAAQRLQKYCTEAGLTPLASEWWHFNDLATLANAPGNSRGEYVLTNCYSVYPTAKAGDE